MNTLPKHVGVCIIGGGVAGLGAAQQLIQSGVEDILILEAQDRVGGRVFTARHGEHYIELGAHWIHGEEGNVVYEWAAENGLVADEASVIQTGYGRTIFVRQNGKLVPEEVVDRFMMVAANIQESGEEELKTYPHSVGQYYTEKFKPLNTWGTVGDELLEWEHRFINCINASDNWYDISGNRYVTYKECPGDPTINWKQDGFQNLINHLQEKVPSSRVMLNSPVKCIEWGVATVASASGCRVLLESGSVVSADHVIVTPSLGVLKAKAKSLFSPALPLQKMNAIEGLNFGVVGKIFLQFSHQWWDDDCDGFSILSDLQELPAVITKENWECGLMGFYAVYKQPNMMCGWMSGPTATAVEQTPECEVGQRCVRLLRKLLSPKWTVPDATWCKRSVWGLNPYTRGSYSFHCLKSEKLGVEASDLAQPLLDSNNNPLVCFAGEATHHCYYSTVHGALETGRREATRLTQHINRLPLRRPVREKYKVVIVGGGAAGIGAARELTHHGIKSVLILEGSDRVGGRVNTVPTPRHGVVELGAQWVHGQDGNVVYKAAASRGLLHHQLSVDGKGNFYAEDGKVINQDIVKQVMEVMNDADEECIKFCHNNEDNNIAHLSVGEVFRKKFLEHLKECQDDSEEARKIKEALFYWHLRWQRIDNACDSLHQLSAKCWGLYIFCDGNENMNPKAGYISILEALLTESTADVKLCSEVACIDYTQEVHTKRDGYVRQDGTTYPVLIRCLDGSEYEAQHVIVTPSIGYLKAHPHLFTPPLPLKLHQTVSSRGYGTFDKIFLEYDDAWWWDGCEGIQLVWTKEIPDFERHDPHTKCIDGTCEKMSDYWVHAISGFDPVFNQPAVLCGWIGGPEAEYMESLSDQQVSSACTHLLRQFLPNIVIPYPKKVYRSKWASNKFFCGSYSYHSVGCLCCSDTPDTDLNMPVFAISGDGSEVPVVVLAGEANSKKFYSTVHGALQNGMQQAAHYIGSHKKLHGNIKSKM